MSIIKKAGIGIAVIIAIIVLVIGYYGFIPGLSGLMGANTPRDLGVTYTQEDLDNANRKLGVTYATLPPDTPDSESIVMEGFHGIDEEFTDAEITALFNDHSENWGNYPMDDIQVRFNPDGTMELSGKLMTARLPGFAEAKGYDMIGQLDRPELDYLSEPTIYLKGDLDVTNGVVSTDITELQVGRLTLNPDQADQLGNFVTNYAQRAIDPPNLQVSNFDIGPNGCDVQASVPSRISMTP